MENGFSHWPCWEDRLSPEMTDRQLLGLPEHYSATRDLSIDGASWKKLSGLSAKQLVRTIEDCSAPLALRIAVGKLLAETGDPRISPLSPQMIDIPGGAVQIGLPHDQVDHVMDAMAGLGLDRDWILKETPRHTVFLPPYRLGRYPVTHFEYMTFLEDTREERIPTSWAFGRYPKEQGNHPVFGISAEDADAYVHWLSVKTGRNFRLPSEAEWEYAGAGSDSREFPWGNEFLPDHANTAESRIFATTPVGAFPEGASPFGCLDMAGNVEEYVKDDYAPYPGGSLVEDDLVTVVGRHRVARGGSFTRFRDLARNARRHGKFPREIYVMGFRLAESPEPR